MFNCDVNNEVPKCCRCGQQVFTKWDYWRILKTCQKGKCHVRKPRFRELLAVRHENHPDDFLQIEKGELAIHPKTAPVVQYGPAWHRSGYGNWE